MTNATVPTPRPLAPLVKRRRVVLGVVVGWLLMLLAAVFRNAGILAGVWWTFAWGLGIGMSFAAYMVLMLPHWLGLPMLKDRRLDERQRQQLLQTYTLAYRIVGIAVMLGTFYLYTASDGTWPMPRTHDQWFSLLWSVILLVGAMPNMLLAWTEPDYREEV